MVAVEGFLAQALNTGSVLAQNLRFYFPPEHRAPTFHTPARLLPKHHPLHSIEDAQTQTIMTLMNLPSASANRAVVLAYLQYVRIFHRQTEDDPSMRVLRAARRIEYARKSHSQKYPSLSLHRCLPGGLFMELERQCIPQSIWSSIRTSIILFVAGSCQRSRCTRNKPSLAVQKIC